VFSAPLLWHGLAVGFGLNGTGGGGAGGGGEGGGGGGAAAGGHAPPAPPRGAGCARATRRPVGAELLPRRATRPRPPCHTLTLPHAADSKGLLLGNRDEPLSGLGNVQAGKVAEFLLDMQVCVCVCEIERVWRV
jgi:hypothetical protein